MVAVVASAGGVEALSEFVSCLPADFPAAVLVLLHIPPAGPSVLPRILARAGKLPACHPKDGDRLTGGIITVAPPDRHLVVADGQPVAVFGVTRREFARAGQDPGQHTRASGRDVQEHQHRGGKVRGQERDELAQCFHPTGGGYDGHHGRRISSSLRSRMIASRRRCRAAQVGLPP